MEVKQLSLVVTENDILTLLLKNVRGELPVANLKIRVGPDGLSVSGDYPLLVRVPFESLWRLSVAAGKVILQLERLRALGMPVTVFRGIILRLIRESARRETWLDHERGKLIIDMEKLLKEESIQIALNLKELLCYPGFLLLSGGDS